MKGPGNQKGTGNEVAMAYRRNSKRPNPNPRRDGKDAISRWFVVPCSDSDYDEDDDGQLTSSIRLTEFHKDGQSFMIIASDYNPRKDAHEIINRSTKTPWMAVMDKIEKDLLASFRHARKEMCNQGPEQKLSHLVIRFGKVLFRSSPDSISLENMDSSLAIENVLFPLKRAYDTNVSEAFVNFILHEAVPKIGVDNDGEAEFYQVKILDKSRPGATITCKCILNESLGELDLYKIELNEIRHLVVDMSCLDKNVDLRMMLSSKRILDNLTDDEKNSLNDLLKSAVIDSEVKGGLKWPNCKESADGRFEVVGTLHTKVKTFKFQVAGTLHTKVKPIKNTFIKIKIRQDDRFDFKTSTGEVTNLASLRMTELNRQLRDLTLELEPMTEMVGDTLKLIWNHFLCWEGSFA